MIKYTYKETIEQDMPQSEPGCGISCFIHASIGLAPFFIVTIIC